MSSTSAIVKTVSANVMTTLNANPCIIPHKHKAHVAETQQSCAIPPPCVNTPNGADNDPILPVDPINHGYLYVSNVQAYPTDATVQSTGTGSQQAPLILVIPQAPAAISKPVKTPELASEAWVTAALLLVGALLVTFSKRRES